MSEYILRTNNISKKYGNNFALQNVSVEIKRGQIYGLIGKNGAGKTTFMRAITGMISLSNGDIELFGNTDKQNIQSMRKKIGQSIENPALYPNATAEQNLEIQRLITGINDKNCIKKTLEIVGLINTGKKKIKNFSLGMKQRLALAQALITNPEFLILDEPVNGLDPNGIIEVRELIRKLAKENGITILISSHLLDELSQIATHYGIIDNGRLIKQMSAEELENESRKYICIITNEPQKSTQILKENLQINDIQITSDNELHILEQLDNSEEINTLLVKNGIKIDSIYVKVQNLESYFVNLTTS